MAAKVIPLESRFADGFSTELEGAAWVIAYRWNASYGAWFMDLSSVEEGGTVLLGLCLVGGSDLLRPHAVTELGKMFVIDTEGKEENPDFELLGDRYKLIYIPKADVL